MLNRIEKERELAQKLVDYSCNVKSGEKVLITYSDTPSSFVEILREPLKIDSQS